MSFVAFINLAANLLIENLSHIICITFRYKGSVLHKRMQHVELYFLLLFNLEQLHYTGLNVGFFLLKLWKTVVLEALCVG